MQTPLSVPSARKPRRRGLWWKLTLGVFVTLVAAFVYYSRDEPPPDSSDFHFEPLQLTSDQNAYALLTLAAQRLSSTKWSSEEEALLDRMVDGNGWDEPLADDCARQ